MSYDVDEVKAAILAASAITLKDGCPDFVLFETPPLNRRNLCHHMYIQTKTNIGITDEISFLRTALKQSLSQQEGLQVLFDVPNTSDAVQKLSACRVDVLLLDAYAHTGDVREVIPQIKSRFPLLKLLVLSLHTEYDMISDLLDLGINGFLLKSAEIQEIVEAIRCATQSDLYQNKIVTDAFYWKAHHRLRNGQQVRALLSETEKKIIRLLWEEKSTQEIANCIFASISTVEKLKQKIKRKVDTQSVVGIIKYGLRERIIQPAAAM